MDSSSTYRENLPSSQMSRRQGDTTLFLNITALLLGRSQIQVLNGMVAGLPFCTSGFPFLETRADIN